MLKHTKLFTPAGGSVGRADSNDWVLPDPERVVSSKHALITFSNNQYFLTDQSTNGTYHNQGENPLGKGNQTPLSDGDVIGIGDYQLKVSIRRPQAESHGLPKGLGDADFLDNTDRTTFSAAAAAKMQNQAEAQQLDSWLEPGSSGGRDTGEWGYVSGTSQSVVSGENFLGADSGPADPLATFGAVAGSELGLGQDPLSALTGTAHGGPAESGGDWGDDWWKDGSEQDHAPADRHSIQIAPQQTSSADFPPPVEQLRSDPRPQSAAEVASPVTPTPPDNPFADSFAVMHGQQVEGAPGFDAGDSMETAFSGASQQFSQLQPQQREPGVSQVQTPQAPVPEAPQPSMPAAPAPGTGTTSALAAALGLNLSQAQLQQVDQQTAAIVQETVARLIDLLRARTSIKNELRVQRTMIQTEANNPLKFSATAADALTAMFAGNGAFMSPQQAVRDSFDDLSDHQVAVLAGMRAGYDTMLKFFKPENIERHVGQHGGVFASKNAKNWEGFTELYHELLKDPDACYRRLFGEEFATTYENQLAELKNARSLKN